MRTFEAMLGSFTSASATLVSLPIGSNTSVDSAAACARSMMKFTASEPSKGDSSRCGRICVNEPLAPAFNGTLSCSVHRVRTRRASATCWPMSPPPRVVLTVIPSTSKDRPLNRRQASACWSSSSLLASVSTSTRSRGALSPTGGGLTAAGEVDAGGDVDSAGGREQPTASIDTVTRAVVAVRNACTASPPGLAALRLRSTILPA